MVAPHPDYFAKDTRHETGHADTKAYEPQNERVTATKRSQTVSFCLLVCLLACPIDCLTDCLYD